MGKTDKSQAKLQFDYHKSSGPPSAGAEFGLEREPDVPSGEQQELRQILMATQHSLTQIDGKLEFLSYRMDRMTERLDKHAEHLDQSERRVSEVEDGQTQLATGHVKLDKELNSLPLKIDLFELIKHLKLKKAFQLGMKANQEKVVYGEFKKMCDLRISDIDFLTTLNELQEGKVISASNLESTLEELGFVIRMQCM
ncbi:hypothetical protein NDU88_002727 [Pleurodeles waltl]|uniref:Uncharacterized protein n=1 Tax=Pleurodeles waltl TaxID=8319 RepID=A0AAV7SEZ3_PLEWA|nr:hypothetical protein NDU88_002727 [Pleurodeles waltl]